MVAFAQHGEFLSEAQLRGEVHFGGDGLLVVGGGSGQRVAIGIDDGNAARIDALGVGAHAVGGNDAALVFYGAGTCEDVPGMLPVAWPVGGNDDGVVVVGVAHP